MRACSSAAFPLRFAVRVVSIRMSVAGFARDSRQSVRELVKSVQEMVNSYV